MFDVTFIFLFLMLLSVENPKGRNAKRLNWCPYLQDLRPFPIFYFNNFLEDISPFCGASDTPVLDFQWRLPRVSKPGRIPCTLSCFLHPSPVWWILDPSLLLIVTFRDCYCDRQALIEAVLLTYFILPHWEIAMVRHLWHTKYFPQTNGY